MVTIAVIFPMALALGVLLVANDQRACDAAVIDLAGRQRMLCERIALLAHEVSEAPDAHLRAARVMQLTSAAESLRSVQSMLADGQTASGHTLPESEELRQQILAVDPMVIALTQAVEAIQQNPHAARASIADISSAERSFIPRMDGIVDQIQAASSGRLIWLSVAGWSLLTLTGAALGCTLMLILEPGLRMLRQQVFQLAQARDALESARAAAVAASSSKGEFLAHMSHELRTPLNGVIGMIRLLLGTELTPKQRRFAELAEVSSTSLAEVIGEVLDFSKIEAGEIELVVERFDLQLTAERVVDMLAERASAKHLELACEFCPDVQRLVRGDGGRVRQVLVNLVNNAIKFTQVGSVVLRISDAGSDGGTQRVRFSVADTGVGITPEGLARLFHAFAQVHTPGAPEQSGTGLGLVISKQLVERMGGTIGVASEPGRGSEFWFTLPLEAVASDSVHQSPHTLLSPGDMRTLLLDEHAPHRDVLLRQLESMGIRACGAADQRQTLGMIAQERAQGTPFRVVIVDGDSAGANACELARAIAAQSSPNPIALLLLSPIHQLLEPAELQECGYHRQIAKPVHQSALLDSIVDALGAAEGIARLATAPTTTGHGGVLADGDAVSQEAPWVLVAEDNQVNQVLTRELLVAAGLRCELVENGQAAVEAVQRKAYDIVLMDCQMPVMDGFDAAREIRALEARGLTAGGAGHHLPIVALTANALSSDRQRCFDAGMNAHLGKPIDAAALISTLSGLLATHVAGAHAEEVCQ